VVFDCALSYPSGGTYVLSGTEGMRQLTAFRELLGEAMHGQGLRVKRSFTPHMTLMYDRHPVAEHAIEPVSWVAHEFVLISRPCETPPTRMNTSFLYKSCTPIPSRNVNGRDTF
jgi:2'-5' RNA ligase